MSACGSGKSGKKTSDKQSKEVPPVEGFIVKPSVLSESIPVSGTVKPFEETVLMPEVTGRVVKINLPEGKLVKKGTLLVKLFDGDLQAQLHKATTQLKIVEQLQNRQSELLKVEGISKTDYDQTLLQVASIKNDIEVYKVMIQKTEVLAPYDGTIGLRNISVGAIVTSSTALATIRAQAQLKLDFSVPSKYSSEIHQGTKIKFTIQGKDEKYDAAVMATEEGVESTTRNLKVRAIISSKSDALIPGEYASVEIKLKDITGALMIPSQSIIPQERTKQVIIVKNGKAQFKDITTGIRKEATVEVLTGIHAGDTIVTTGILFIKPKAKLKFSKVLN
jgi:membrane fusion protein (multidrug efflux system)